MGRHASDGRATSELAETTVRIPVLRSGGAHRRPLTAATRNRGKLIGAALTATAVLAVLGELALPHHAAHQSAGAMEDVAVPANPAATMHDAAAPDRHPAVTAPLATVAQSTPLPAQPDATAPSGTKSTAGSTGYTRVTTSRATTSAATGAPAPRPTGTQPPSSGSGTSSTQPSRTSAPPTTTSQPGGDGNVVSNLPVVGPVVGGLLPGN